MVGRAPDQTAHNAKEAAAVAVGSFADGALTLRVQPVRIDWSYSPSSEEGFAAPHQTLGALAAGWESFRVSMHRWLSVETRPDLLRLAAGMVLFDEVESRAEGYRRLGQQLPTVQIDADNSSDFSYQINRRRVSRVVPDLELNRLAKWSVSSAQSFVATPTGVTVATTKSLACRLELDMNSSGDRIDILPRAAGGLLLAELGALALEIAESGDVR